MEVRINKTPTLPSEWEKLCVINGNLFQSQSFDKLQLYFQQTPVYFEVIADDKLIAGVKMYHYEARKLNFLLGRISKKLTQQGELILAPDHSKKKGSILNVLTYELDEYVKRNQYVSYESIGYLGPQELLLSLKGRSTSKKEYNTAYVDLTLDESDLLSSFNRNTKRNIKKAIESNVQLEIITDIERFLAVEKIVYDQQPEVSPPNFDFIRENTRSLKKGDFEIGIASYQNKDLASGLIYKKGNIAYSVFGGAVQNDVGAGHFFYFELMKRLKMDGVEKFYFGQVAKEENDHNKKFSKGISNFKRGFRCVELESAKETYTLHPMKNYLWKLILKYYG